MQINPFFGTQATTHLMFGTFPPLSVKIVFRVELGSLTLLIPEVKGN